MFASMRQWYQQFRGIGEAAPTIPALDGPYNPNQILEQAKQLCHAVKPDNLVICKNEIQFTSAEQRFGLGTDGSTKLLEEHTKPITAMAVSNSGELAIAESGGIVVLRGGKRNDETRKLPIEADITAMVFSDEDQLVICVGSARNPVADWTRDLLEKRPSGSLWRVDLATGEIVSLYENLAYPNGIIADQNGDMIISEAWRNRLIKIQKNHQLIEVIGELPGYPSRLVRADDGGAWLAIMAPRNQLLEFVLREDDYRQRLLNEVAPENWIAPALAPPESFLKPMQQGSQRSLGILKPWSPGFSIGMVIKFNAAWRPQYILFSRADGQRHGVTSLVEHAGELVLSSIGGSAIISTSLQNMGH